MTSASSRSASAACGDFGSGGGASSTSTPPAPEIVRFFFFSTTTDFERPWLKLWRTWPDSTVRFRLSGLRVSPRSVLSVVSFVSLI